MTKTTNKEARYIYLYMTNVAYTVKSDQK